MFDTTQKSRATLYLDMAKKMGEAAELASDPECAATYLELAGKWIRLAEATSRYAGDDDLPARQDPDENSFPPPPRRNATPDPASVPRRPTVSGS